MANILNRNPLVIDTPGATVLIDTRVFVSKITWQASALSAAGDKATVTNTAGDVLFDASANGANFIADRDYHQHGSLGLSALGLVVPTLANGKLYIHYN